MPKLTVSQLKNLSRKTQFFVAIALLLGAGTGVFLTMQNGQPQSVVEIKQASSNRKNGMIQGDGAHVTGATAPASDTSAPSTANNSTHQQTTAGNQTTAGDTAPNPAPTPASTPAPDPCDKTVVGPVVTYPDTGISFVESVTIPVGCTAGPFTVKTTDSRSVTFYGFTNKPTSPVKGVMSFASTQTGSSASYTVVTTNAATPGYYEDFAMIDDASSPYGMFAMTIKITVVAR